MPTHEIPWPQWTREENIICVWFSALGLAIPDIARIIEHKLGRPPRHSRGYFRQMDRINQEEAEKGRPRLCGRDMLDWDRAAVDNFLILRTDDTDLLDYLLWFGEEHLGLLRTHHGGQYLGRGIPLNQAVDVEDMQYQWARLLKGSTVIQLVMEGVTSFEEPLLEACRNMHWGQFLAVEYVREY